ncbi:peptidylprolyl isomerase [Methanoregula sp.]|uniref:FKBP-type peptidyl-prolyl cis-trans isomerase n=1 Tax=Methanoregula sp. TaxID=2052170 RepID=UPI00261663B8|nr:peptidylprolyl isomerase [Methanoregula sp.]MDD5144096.1 peptidylprolyl isomerase [Methanoregula sp.]
MKKSEKVKGKEAVAAKKKKMRQYAIGAVVALVVIAVVTFYFFNPFFAKSGDTVSVYYTGSLADGTVFDSNLNAAPIVFTIGQGKVIPGLEEAVIGMAPNTTKTVHIPMAKAYGPYDSSLVFTVNRSDFGIENPVMGERYSIRRATDNAVAHIRIINMTEDTITIDPNHDLAGKDLVFTVTLVRIA